ncbi:testis specific protein Y-linked isoform X2 [Lepisosteus oculatus]|uniref:testis specific protein Y-linked isoform X2 n=1 Tax=Lepisosteus oculatus TaxID=7918 RepID=UPI0035F508C4
MSDVSDGEEPTSGKRRRTSPGPGRSPPPAKAARVDGSEPESALAPRGENGEPEARAGAAEAEQLPGERASAAATSANEERKGGSAPSPSSAGGGAPVPASSCGGGGAPSSSEAPGAAAAPGGSAHLEEPSDWAAMAAAEALASLTGAGRGGGVQAEAQEGPGGDDDDDDDDDSSSPALKRQGGGSGVQPGSPTPPGASAAGPGGEGREEGGEPAADSPGGPSSPPPRCQEDAECAIVSVKVVPETRRSVALLARVQGSLEAIERRAARVYRRMELKFNSLRRPHLEERGNIIQTIPGFWVTAFLNHPQLSAHIDENDEDALSYMTSLEVDGFKSSRMGYRICFQFSRNPYFQNNFIVKEFHVGEGGSLTSLSNPILWHRGRNLAALGGMAKGQGSQRVYQSFFSWFTDHSSPSADEIAEILKDDLWKNPLRYYLTPMWELKENGSADKGKGNGDECVVISDSDEDEGEEGLSREEDEEQSASEEGESVEESDGEGEVVIDGSEDSEAEGSGEEDSSGDEGDEEELEVEELDLDDSLEVRGQEAEGQQGEEEDMGVGDEDDS